MKASIIFIALIYSPVSSGVGPAGEIVSLNCSYAINSALEHIKENNIKINITLKEGHFVCITPNREEIYIRLQSPALKVQDKKHLFIINAKTYEIISSSFSR